MDHHARHQRGPSRVQRIDINFRLGKVPTTSSPALATAAEAAAADQMFVQMLASLATAEAHVVEQELHIQSLRAQLNDAKHAAHRSNLRIQAAHAAQDTAEAAAHVALQHASCMEDEVARLRAAAAVLVEELQAQGRDRHSDAEQAAAHLQEAQVDAAVAWRALRLARREHQAREAQLRLRLGAAAEAAAELQQQLQQREGEAVQAEHEEVSAVKELQVSQRAARMGAVARACRHPPGLVFAAADRNIEEGCSVAATATGRQPADSGCRAGSRVHRRSSTAAAA